MNKKQALLLTNSIFLACMASNWVYVFSQVLKKGQVVLAEPNMDILLTEFTLAICFIVLGVFGWVVSLRK